VHTEKIGTSPGTDALGIDYWGVFEHEGKLYRVKYTDGNSYWLDQMGSWEDPFILNADRNVDCEEVVAHEVITITYEPVKD